MVSMADEGTVLRNETQEELYGTLEPIKDALKFLRAELAALKKNLPIHEDGRDSDLECALEDVDTAVDGIDTSITEFVENIPYVVPDIRGLQGDCMMLVDSVRMGLHDEPKSVSDFALKLEDALRAAEVL